MKRLTRIIGTQIAQGKRNGMMRIGKEMIMIGWREGK